MSHPLEVHCFCEDIAHENFIYALIKRVAEEKNQQVSIEVLNATEGSKVWDELRQYLHECSRGKWRIPDLLVVVKDGNCEGSQQVRRRIQELVRKCAPAIPQLVSAVPDPHIERWYLEDQKALKAVLPGARTQKLRYKCEKERYKNALLEAFYKAGIVPLSGGAEYGERIAQELDPSRMDLSFQTFFRELQQAFRR
jgi:hypothetical protein